MYQIWYCRLYYRVSLIASKQSLVGLRKYWPLSDFCISLFSFSSHLLCHVSSLNPTVSRRNPRPPMRSPPKPPGLLSISSESAFLYRPFSHTANYIHIRRYNNWDLTTSSLLTSISLFFFSSSFCKVVETRDWLFLICWYQ